MLKWVDEYGYIAACLDFSGERFVTIAMNDIQFKKSVKVGEILRFQAQRMSVGNTSVSYEVVVSRDAKKQSIEVIFDTKITYVCIDENGETKSLA